mmetsp:Transcript_22363/g.42660  ORF Transcript_22363/g.42660 Transcript_22363/m.42660 type:complete len:144 (-) Transcript_22363:50-481(-)
MSSSNTAAERAPFATNLNNDKHIPLRSMVTEQQKTFGKAAKRVIYHNYSRPPTSEPLGRKPAHNSFDTFELPFAKDGHKAFSDAAPMAPLPSNARRAQGVAGKVGTGGYQPTHYAEQVTASKTNVDVARYISYTGAGKITEHA